MANGIEAGLLVESELFHELDGDALSASIACASRVNLRRGAELLKQGDAPEHLFLVERGKIKMTVVTPEGSQLTLRFMTAGDIIGCAAVFRGIVYPATATAVEDTRLLCWTAGQINELIRAFPQLASNALAIVGGRAEDFLQRLREATTEKVEQRIARALLRTATGKRKPGDGAERVMVSRQELAEIASTSLYTVSRTVSAWARQGIVTAGRGNIAIRNRGRLAAIAGTGATHDE
jgi:CRP/FNR family transcriptional regulator, nitrogen oxide reductase regulator